MRLTVKFNIENHDLPFLKDKLFCNDDNALKLKLESITNAAFEEYLKMILSDPYALKIGKDSRAYRLLLLTKYLFKGAIPNERQIGKVFTCDLKKSSALIKDMMDAYPDVLKQIMFESLKKMVLGIWKETNGENYKIVLDNNSLKAKLNEILTGINSELTIISKDRGKNLGTLEPASYDALCVYFNIPETEKK